VDFVSITVALYALIVFYVLTRTELQGKRPLAKFLSIKLIVFFTFYQEWVFDLLASYNVIKPTTYWTTDNIADGLNALTTTVEMLLFSLLMLWSFPAKEYMSPGAKTTSIWRPLWDSINFTDFLYETWLSFKFFWDYIRGKPYARAKRIEDDNTERQGYADFDDAFGIEERQPRGGAGRQDVEMPMYNQPPAPNRRRSYGPSAPAATQDSRGARYNTLRTSEDSQPLQGQTQPPQRAYAPPQQQQQMQYAPPQQPPAGFAPGQAYPAPQARSYEAPAPGQTYSVPQQEQQGGGRSRLQKTPPRGGQMGQAY